MMKQPGQVYEHYTVSELPLMFDNFSTLTHAQK